VQYIEHIFQHLVRVQFIIVIGAVAKSGSFGFAKRWLVCRAKPNVPLVRLAKIVFKKVRWEKK